MQHAPQVNPFSYPLLLFGAQFDTVARLEAVNTLGRRITRLVQQHHAVHCRRTPALLAPVQDQRWIERIGSRALRFFEKHADLLTDQALRELASGEMDETDTFRAQHIDTFNNAEWLDLHGAVLDYFEAIT